MWYCRGMIMPDDKNITFLNCIGMGVVLLIVYVVASLLHALSPTVLEVVLACLGLMLVAMVVIGRFTKVSENLLYQQSSGRAMILVGIALAAGTVLQLVLNASSDAVTTGLVNSPTVPYIGNTASCLDSISSGAWVKGKCSTDPALLKSNKLVYCQTDQWLWDNAKCPIGKFSAAKMKATIKGKKVVFVGDSLVRSSYHQFISLIDPTYTQNRSFDLKHSNIDYQSANSSSSISFIWAPLIADVATVYDDVLTTTTTTATDSPIKLFKYDLVVAGVSYWDALHKHDSGAYKAALDTLSDTMAPVVQASPGTINIWLLPTTVVNHLLQSPEKRLHMTEEAIETYKEAFKSSKAATSLFKTVINPANVSRTREAGSVDGVHYTSEVYQVIAHMISNGYALHFPQISAPGKPGAASAKPYVPKKTGSMSSPYHGALMLVLSVVMLFLMDSFLGIGFFSLAICGRAFDWEAAYGPLHKKISASLQSSKESERPEHKIHGGDRSAETDSLLERSGEAKNLAV